MREDGLTLFKIASCLCVFIVAAILVVPGSALAAHKLKDSQCYDCHNVGGSIDDIVSGSRLIKKDSRVIEILNGGWSTGTPLPCIYCHDDAPRSVRTNMVGVKNNFTSFSISRHPVDPYLSNSDGTAGLDCIECHTNVQYVGQAPNGGSTLNPNIHGKDVASVGWTAGSGSLHADSTYIGGSPYNADNNTFCTTRCHDSLPGTGYPANQVAHGYTSSIVSLEIESGFDAVPDGCIDESGLGGCHSAHNSQSEAALITQIKSASSVYGTGVIQAGDCGICHTFDDPPRASSDWIANGHGRFETSNGINCTSCHDSSSPHFQTDGTAAGNRLSFVEDPASSGFSIPAMSVLSNCVSSNCHAVKSAHSAKPVGCLDCHDPHGDAVAPNLSMLRRTPPVAAPASSVVYETVGAYFDTAYAGSFGVYSNAVCDNQDCHSGPTGPGPIADIMDPATGTHPGRPIYTGCDSCHQHDAAGGSFSPSGCDSCHGDNAGQNWPDTESVLIGDRPDRAGAHTAHITALGTGNSACDTCHPLPGSPRAGTGETVHDDTSEPADVHSDARAGADLSYFKDFLAVDDTNATYDTIAETCSNIDCHGENLPPAWYSGGTVTCTSCHNNGTDDGQLINAHPGSGLHATHVAVANSVVDDCAPCHGSGANTGSQAGHWDGIPSYNSTNISSYANTSCTNACHAVSGANDWQSGATINCMDCHVDIPTDYIGPAPNSGLHAASNALAHDNTFTASNYTCTDCHNDPPTGINHIDGTSQSSTQASYSFSAANIASYTSTGGCAAACHFDSAKWSRKWIGVIDAAAAGNPGDPVCDNCHGDGLSNATTVDDVWRGGVVPIHQTDWDGDATPGEVLDPVSNHSTCQACHGWGNAAYNPTWGGVSPAHGDTRLTMNGPVGTGAEYDSTQRGCLSACHSGLLDSVSDPNYAHTMADSGWALNFGDFGSGDCDTCHASNGRAHNDAAESGTTHNTHGTADADYVAGCNSCHVHDGLTVPPNTGVHNDGTVNFGGSYMTTVFNYTTTFSDASCGAAANGCHNATGGDWAAGALSDCADCHDATGKNLFAGGGASMTQTVPPATAKHTEHVANTAYVNACTSCHTHDGVSGTLSNHVDGPTAASITLGSQITPPLAADNSCTNACHLTADTRDWEVAGALLCTDCHEGTFIAGDNSGTGGSNYLPVSGLHAVTGTDANSMAFVTHDETLDAARCDVCHTANPSAAHIDGAFDTPPTVFDAAINYGYDSTDSQSFCLGGAAGCHVDNAKLYRLWSAAVDCTICHGKDSSASIGVYEAPANDGGSNTGGIVYGHTSVATNGTATSGEHSACTSCHWGTGAEDTGINDHVDRASGSTIDVAYDYSQSTGKCGTNCHGSQADTWLWQYNSTIPVNAYAKTLACGACHNDGGLPPTSGSHAQHVANANTDYTECEACHGAPVGGAWDAASYPHNDASLAFASSVTYSGGTGGTCSTTNCHSAPANQATWGSNASMACNECHYWDTNGTTVTSAGNAGHFASISADHGNHFDANYYCTDCHADNSLDTAAPRGHILSPAGTDGVVLTARANAVQDDADVTVATWNDTDDTCANTVCHNPSGTSYMATWQTSAAGCSLCHSDTDPGTGSHTAHNTPSLSGTFGLSIICGSCHLDNTGSNAHRNGSIDFIPGIAYAASTCTTTVCHNDGTGTANPTPAWGTASPNCSICHAASPVTNAHGSHLSHPVYLCADCHTLETAATHINDGVTLTGKASSYSGNTTVGDGGLYGSCSTGSCHDVPTNIDWNLSATNCSQCHEDTTDTNDYNGRNTLASEVASGEFGSVGHGGKGLVCLDCHNMTPAHDFSNPVGGTNPYRLNAGFTCTDNAAACHDGVPTASVATVVTHSQPAMSTAGYSTKYGWSFAPDCVNCHDPHGDGSNLSMIQRDLFDKAAFPVNASPPIAAIDNSSLVFTDNTSGLTSTQQSYADYTGYDSVCQECHEGTPGTDTPYAFADDVRANSTGHPGYVSTASDNPGDCSDCHKHDEAFKPSGCNGCHGAAAGQYWPDGSGGNPAYVDDSLNGAVRHDNHVLVIGSYLGYGSTTSNYDDAQQKTICAYCHPDPGGAGHSTDNGADAGGSGRVNVYHLTDGPVLFRMFVGAAADTVDGSAGNYDYANLSCVSLVCHNRQTTPTAPADNWDGTTGPACALCHTSDPPANTNEAHAEHTSTRGYACTQCHVDNGTQSGHQSGEVDITFTGGLEGTVGGDDGIYSEGMTISNLSYRGSTWGTCSNVYCHNDKPTPAWNLVIADNGCTDCHTVGDPVRNPNTGLHDEVPVVSGIQHDEAFTYSGTGADCTTCHTTTPSTNHVDGTFTSSWNAAPPSINFAGSVGFTDGATPTCSPSLSGCHTDGGDWQRIWHENSDGGGGAGSECAGCHGGFPGQAWTFGATADTGDGQVEHDRNWNGIGGTDVIGRHATATTPDTMCNICHVYRDNPYNSSAWANTWHGNNLIDMNSTMNYDSTTWSCQDNCHTEGGSHAMEDSGWNVNPVTGPALSCTACHGASNPSAGVGTASSHLMTVVGGANASCESCHPGGTKGAQHSQNSDPNVVVVRNNSAVGITYSHVVDGANQGFVLGGDATSGQTEAQICWGCHDQDNNNVWGSGDISEWGTNINAATGSESFNYGSLDQIAWSGATWSSANFSYKSGSIQSTHSVNASGSSALGGGDYNRTESPDAVSLIRCSYCHDVHNTAGAKGVTGDVDGEPYLRGTWKGNPYKEDGAPQNTGTGSGPWIDTGLYDNVPRAYAGSDNALGGYWIDQNSGDPNSGETLATTAGLCALCHTVSSPGNAANWVSGYDGHANVIIGGAGRGGNASAESENRNIFNRTWRGSGDMYNARNRENNAYVDMGVVNVIATDDRGFSYRTTNTRGLQLQPYLAGGSTTRPYAFNDFQWNNEWGSQGIAAGTLSLQVADGNTNNNANPDTEPYDGANDMPSYDAQANYHTFSCSKCHNPHASRLPKLMITNCLDTSHNTWDENNTTQYTGPDAPFTNSYASQWAGAQNCHRVDERGSNATPDITRGRGWNKVTPW